MNPEEMEKYEGKKVIASYYHSTSRGIVFRGKFYRIDVDIGELEHNNLVIKLLEYSPEDLIGIDPYLSGKGKLSLLERGILHSLELNLPAVEAFIPFSKVKFKTKKV